MGEFLALKEIMQKATTSEHGLALVFDYSYQAGIQRRRLYAERDKLRKAGETRFDNLSFLIKNKKELWVVSRNNKTTMVSIQSFRPLQKEEIPKLILSRGKSWGGIDIS